MAKYPVVVYGASGYTGMLVMDWLIDQNIPFTAIARNVERAKEMMPQRVVRLESATYELIECAHEVDALTKAFKGARVICNTVGPFADFGLTAVEAALRAGAHYIDSTGEQGFILDVREKFGALFAEAGLLVSPSVAYMYSFAEIAAEIALETPGIDALETATISRGPRGNTSGVTVGSTATIFEGYRMQAHYLWENRLVPHAPQTTYNVVAPDFLEPVFCLPWGGTSLPVFFENDPRVRSCISCVGFYDTKVMHAVHAFGEQWESQYKHMTREQQDEVIRGIVDSTTPTMPPRERSTLQRTVDFAIGRGNLSSVRATVHGQTPYISTGALHAAAVEKLIENDTAKTGFASASKAFGHRYLLGFLEQRGLARASVKTI